MVDELDARQLGAFQAVVEHGSISGAARWLGVSQSAVTRAVAALERRIGVPLVERDGRGSRPTAAGRVLAGHATRLRADTGLALAETRAAALPGGGQLRLGISGHAGGRLQHRVVVAAAESGLNVAAIASNATADRVAAVARGDLDIAFARLTRTPGPEFAFVPLRAEPLLLALPDTHPFAQTQSVPLAALHNQPLAFYRRSQNPWWYDEVLGLLRDHGARPRIVHRALWAFEITPLVLAGRAFGLISTAVTEEVRLPGMTYRRLDPVAPLLGLGLLWARDSPASGALARLVELALDAADRGP